MKIVWTDSDNSLRCYRAYKALNEAHDLLSDNHIHIEFCHVNDVGNNESANYNAVIWNKDITKY